MIGSFFRASTVAVLAAGMSLAVGCSSSKESAQRDALTANVGNYSPAPQVAYHPRVGVPPFKVQEANGGGDNLDTLAADQMTTLLFQSGRFNVIERAQLNKLLDEQNLEGIVKPGELAKPGQVRGVDYLLIGKVTNLRVKKENKSNNFGLAQLGGVVQTGGLDVKNSNIVLTTDCGVDIRLVDPTTGEMMMANQTEYQKTDSAGSMGVSVLGANAESNADIQLSEDDKGKILRLALDDCLRKSLPKIDVFIASHQQPTAPAAAAPTAAAPAATATPAANSTVAAKRFCPNCGKEVPAGVKFCPNCGAKLD